MSAYEKLAEEMMQVLDRRGPVPPQDKLSKTVRGEMAVLRLLEREERQMTAGDISQMLQMKTPRIAAVLNSLEKKELIKRSADACDRRRVMVELTQNGLSFCLQRKQEAKAHMTKILMHLGETDAKEFVRLMKRLHEILPLIGPIHPQENSDKEETDE